MPAKRCSVLPKDDNRGSNLLGDANYFKGLWEYFAIKPWSYGKYTVMARDSLRMAPGDKFALIAAAGAGLVLAQDSLQVEDDLWVINLSAVPEIRIAARCSRSL